MSIHQNHEHFVLEKALHSPMNKIYTFQAFFIFVKNLIGLFVPVYLYSLGFSLIEISLYVVGLSLSYLIAIPAAIKLINKTGFKYAIIISLPFFLAHITVLQYIPQHNYLIHLAWLTFGLHSALFWPSFHSEVESNSSRYTRGSQVGTLQIITTLVSSLAPLIGGWYFEYIGYLKLLILSAIILVIGTLPLIFSKDVKLKRINFGYKDYLTFLKTHKYSYSKKAFSSQGIEKFLAVFVWPIILYTLLNENFMSLGTLFTFISFVSIIFISYYKTYFDNHDRHTLLKKVVKALSTAWLLRSLLIFVAGSFLYIVESFFKLTSSLYMLSFNSIFYNNAQKLGHVRYIIFRELYLHMFKTLAALVTVAILYFTGGGVNTLWIIIFTGVFFSLGLGYLREE